MSFFKFSTLFFVMITSLFAYPNYSAAMKEKKLYLIGEKIYKKKCPNLNLTHYKNYDSLEKDLKQKNVCGTLNSRYADALGLYLWEVKKNDNKAKRYPKLEVTKEDKCPVCGMFLYKYPRWVARIEYKDKNVSFDGIKDLMKYYFEHKENVKDILVQEYYTQKTINAKEAYFVVGSDVYGPMGNEFIAFKDERSAKHFLLDHRGKKIVKFSEITPDEVYELDE
ncbi:nitrous oxide reductase accessory protein NosL [Sulfurimonas sp.]|uniref:nitrous oxide reductase accessory protein NosL n=1 Tax=Sulfurimonas sp. TaxID=2022749 RepID=UPI002602B53A|nr:nitrous oxide reductase accessory protein NosL [Sulfurimonas sp.]